MSDQVKFSDAEVQVLLQYWLQKMFPSLGSLVCQRASSLNVTERDEAKNSLLKSGYLILLVDIGNNAVALSDKGESKLFAKLLVMPTGQTFFKKLMKGYAQQPQLQSYYSYDTVLFQMNLIAGMLLGEDTSAYLCGNMGRYRNWMDQYSHEDTAPVERFLADTVFNLAFLAPGIASPRVAAILLARLGYRLIDDKKTNVLKKYLAILSSNPENWISMLKSDKLEVFRVQLAFFFYLLGRLDFMMALKPHLPATWKNVIDGLEKGDADDSLSTLRKLLEAMPLAWQELIPKTAMVPAFFIQFMLLIGLRSGKAAILQTERLLATVTNCFDYSCAVWQYVRQNPFPADRFTWNAETEKAFDDNPLAYSFSTLFAAMLLRDTPQHLVPADFARFALRSFSCLLDAGFVQLAYQIKTIMQAYLPDNEEWQKVELEDLPIVPLFLPERKRSDAELYLNELVKILKDARDRREKEDATQETKDFGFQIELREIGSSGFYQVDQAAPCLVTHTKKGLTRLKRISLNRVKRGQYDQIMDRKDHLIANLIQDVKGALDDDTAIKKIHFTDLNATVLESPRKFFLKGDTIPLLMKVEPLRLSLEVNQDSVVIQLPPALPEGIEDPYFLEKHGKRSFSVILVDAEVKKLFELLHKWGDGSHRKIRLTGKAKKTVMELIPAFSQISPYLQVLGTGSAIEDVTGSTVLGTVNLELRIGTTPDNQYQMEMLCHPIPDDKTFEIKPGMDAAGILRSTSDGSVTVTRDLRRERFEAERVINACPTLDAHPPTPYQWRFEDRGKLLEFIAEFERMGDKSIRMTFPENQAWNVTQLNAPLELKHIETNSRGWFEIGAEIRVDENRVLQLMDLLTLYRSRQGNFIELGENQYAHVSDETIRQLELLDLYKGRSNEKIAIPQGFVPLLTDLQEASGGNAPEEMARIRDEISRKLSTVPALPRDIDVSLRPYQADAFRWLMCHYTCQLGGACLADDMGLGKTIELLVFLKAVAQNGPSLVVVPTSLVNNWCSEAMRFTPTLNVIHFAEDRDTEIDKLEAGDVLIISYGLLSNEIDRIEKVHWNVAVLDEAQAIKNSTALRTTSAKRILADFRIVATGTPIENNLLEFWSLFDFILPGLLGTKARFKEIFDDDATREEERPALRKLVTPFILRRLKRDVLKDLPPKTEILLPVEFSEDERIQYESIRRAAIERITDPSDRISILASLMRLRRTCCHPSLVINDYQGDGAKIEKLLELAESLKRNGHRALVFSQFVDMLTLVRKAFEKHGYTYQYLDGATVPKERTAAVNAFQSGNGDFFLISLKAGGTGLNLTAADYVIILDPWWNPAVESQAADRAHRIGQHRPVTIYRLVTKDTVEEKVIALHAVKQRLVEDMLADTESATLTPDELMSLFT